MALQIDQTEKHGDALLKVKGEVDLYSSPELRSAILKGVKAKGDLGIDLSGVDYMDSSGVATLVEGLKMVSQENKAFVLVAPSNPVMKVLQLARLDSVFDIREKL